MAIARQRPPIRPKIDVELEHEEAEALKGMLERIRTKDHEQPRAGVVAALGMAGVTALPVEASLLADRVTTPPPVERPTQPTEEANE